MSIEDIFRDKTKFIPGLPKKGFTLWDLGDLKDDPAAVQTLVAAIRDSFSPHQIDLLLVPDGRSEFAEETQAALSEGLEAPIGLGFVYDKLEAPPGLKYAQGEVVIPGKTLTNATRRPGNNGPLRVGFLDNLINVGKEAENIATMVKESGGKLVHVCVLADISDTARNRLNAAGISMTSLTSYRDGEFSPGLTTSGHAEAIEQSPEMSGMAGGNGKVLRRHHGPFRPRHFDRTISHNYRPGGQVHQARTLGFASA